jgi:hypothetical protein
VSVQAAGALPQVAVVENVTESPTHLVALDGSETVAPLQLASVNVVCAVSPDICPVAVN